MYKITRKSQIIETLQLCNLNGEVVHEIPVEITIDGFIGQYNKCRDKLLATKIAAESKDNSETNVEAYGNAIISLMQLIFGEENANTILQFYDNRYGEMLVDIFPFITEVIQPQLQQASKARMEQFKKMSKRK